MQIGRHLGFWLLALLVLSGSFGTLIVARARAQVSPAEKAAAEALFDRGLVLMREGKLQEACASLEQSQAIERGIGTMLYLAECYERGGRTASAWALFRQASSEARASGQVERAEAGRQRAERLEPLLGRLSIEVPESQRVPGLEVLRNGVPVPEGAWGIAVPVDPGEHRVEARAPGYLSYVQTVAVQGGPGSWSVKLPALEEDPAANTAAPADAQGAAAPSPAVATEPSRPSRTDAPRGRAARITGIVLGSAGVALLAVGGGFGIRAIKKKGDVDDLCPGDGRLCDDPDGVEASEQAKSASTIANVGLIGGGALLAGGLLTYFLAPKSDTQVGLAVDGRRALLKVGGVF